MFAQRSRLMTLLMGQGAAVDPITYLFRDTFTTAASAPLTSPRTCEPGPGTMTITDSANKLAIASGKLTCTGKTTNEADPTAVSVDTFARVRGLCTLGLWNQGATQSKLGFGNNAGSTASPLVHAIVPSNTSLYTATALDEMLMVSTITTGTDYQYAIVLRSPGAWYFVRGGAQYPDWTLIWVDGTTTTTPLRLAVGPWTADADYKIDYMALTQLAAPWDNQNGIALGITASPATGAQILMVADGIVEFTWTPASSEVMEFDVRRTDADNRWIIRCDQAGGTIKLIERNAGSETERATYNIAWTVGAARRLVVSCLDQEIRVYWTTYLVLSYTSASFNKTATLAAVAGFATGANLISWPRTFTGTTVPTVTTELLSSIYVSTDGNDGTGTGKVTAPYLTLAKALTVASSGATIYIADGSYAEDNGGGKLTITNVAASAITIQPLLGVAGDVTISNQVAFSSASHVSIKWLKLSAGVAVTGGDNITCDTCTITGPVTGGGNCDAVTFTDCAVTDTAAAYAVTAATNWTISGGSSTITDNGTTVQFSGELSLYTTTFLMEDHTVTHPADKTGHSIFISTGTDGSVVDNVTLVSSYDYGLVLKECNDVEVKNCHLTGGTEAALLFKAATNCNVHDNEFIASDGAGITLNANSATGNKSGDNTITGNTFTVTGTANIFEWGDAAADSGGCVCDTNTYKISGTTGNYGSVYGNASSLTTIAELRTNWLNYDVTTNDANSTES